LRAAWRVLVSGKLDGRRFVFVDECSTNTSLSPIYGWARRGHRAYFEAPRNWGANVTLLSSMSLEGMGPSLAVEGPTTREVFETYLEKVLAPALREGQIMVMDNLSSHKGSRVRGADRRVWLRAYVPAALLPGPQPHRRSVLKAQGAVAPGWGTHPRSSAGSDGWGARCGEGERCQGLLRASRLPPIGSNAMTNALGWISG
jgi:hypothetical protein